MATILTWDLKGSDGTLKGNAWWDEETGTYKAMPLQKRPDGTTYRTGGNALFLENAKALDMWWRPWEIVNSPSGQSQESVILRYCERMGIPIRRFEWRDKALVAEYFARNPDKRPSADPVEDRDAYVQEVAALIASTQDPLVGPGRRLNENMDINKAPARQLGRAISIEEQRRIGAVAAREREAEQAAYAAATAAQAAGEPVPPPPGVATKAERIARAKAVRGEQVGAGA